MSVALVPFSIGGCDAEDQEAVPRLLSISQVRDNDFAREITGKVVEVSGVVVADFRGPDQLGGVYIQDIDTEDAQSASAMFIHISESESISVGDLIHVGGILVSGGDRPRLKPVNNAGDYDVRNDGQIVAVKPAELPFDGDAIDWEDYDGRLVRFTDDMIVTDTHDLARYGQVTLSASERLYVPTELIDPNDPEPTGESTSGSENVAAIRAAETRDQNRSIVLDDGSAKENPQSLFLLPEATGSAGVPRTLRLGTRIKNLTGVVTKVRGRYMVMPAGTLDIEYVDRPSVPDLGDCDLTIASFNVLNYFTTIDDGRNQARGADNPEEFQRQEAKLVAALKSLDADVIGLMELENKPGVEESLVAALNSTVDGSPYRGVGRPDGLNAAPGGKNAIRVGLIYRSDLVEPTGKVQMVVDEAFANARTPLVQEFRLVGDEIPFSVVVNHFKSKGSRGAKGPERDMKDGQGANNASRRKQAEAIAGYVATLQQTRGAVNLLVLGDLNAYSQEDPIDTLRAAGLVDLIHTHAGEQSPYSYVYYGRAGCLDHAFATPELAAMVSGAAIWHINSSEPRFLDYNLEFNPKPFYRQDPFRSSDHDPVLVGIDLR
ncbi:extracellular nuclease [Rhodopirellula sallentina SM41]|uniref:Extracellular nuclease n=1 Tax=Rhodopirellula sallentina SM41 TaxID=1263870 RepID=M5U920_9BACT|nr:extracellular nuclease [Rhodopirellula sallentina SM41]